MMDAEKRTQTAILITRELLQDFLADASAIATMTFDDINPEDIEDQVSDILKYLEATKPEDPEKTYEEAMTQASKTYKKGIKEAEE